MRKMIITVIAALGLLGLSSTAALASTQAPGIRQAPGASASVTAAPFTAQGTETEGGLYTCKGVHIMNSNGTSEDIETCRVTGISAAEAAANPTGVYSGDPDGYVPFGGVGPWFSDYNGATASSWVIGVHEHGNGTATEGIEANFPSGVPA